MRVLWVVPFLLLTATAAAAQSTYVGGSLIGEFARFSGIDVDEDGGRLPLSIEPLSRDGESIGFDVRVGRALGSRWGFELALARGGAHEQRRNERFPFVGGVSTTIFGPGVPIPGTTTLSLPTLQFAIQSEQRHTTFDAAAWFRQELSERVDLMFLGGVSFIKTEAEQEIDFDFARLSLPVSLSEEIEWTSYGVGPVVGTEAIVELTERAALTAGVRLLGVSASGSQGWLIRPSAGARFSF